MLTVTVTIEREDGDGEMYEVAVRCGVTLPVGAGPRDEPAWAGTVDILGTVPEVTLSDYEEERVVEMACEAAAAAERDEECEDADRDGDCDWARDRES